MNLEKMTKALAALGLVVVFLLPVALAHYFESESVPHTAAAAKPAADHIARGRAARESIRNGELGFIRNCGMCHGFEASGKVGVAPSLSNPDFLALATDGFIRKTVREGRLGTAMAPRRDVPRETLNDIIAYLRSLPQRPITPVALDLDRQARGDAENGRHNFSAYCSSCHGPNGGGYVELGTAPGIGLPGFLRLASDDYILQTVKRGRVGTPMRSFLGSQGLANLSEQDIDDIIVFLRSNDPALEPDFSERMGEETYQRNCAACHQPGGQGLVGVAPSLSSPEFLALASDDLIRKTVRRGRLGTPMVPRHGITDWELEAIVEYLRSLPANGKSDLEVDYDLRIEGDAERGRQNFTTYCAPCHGPRGEGYAAGGSGPGIGLPSFLGAVADDYIFKTVKYGRTGTPMRPFVGPQGLAQLEEEDVNDIVVFLRSRSVFP